MWLLIIGIIVVGLIVHFAVDAPEMQQRKETQQKAETDYIHEKGISVTAMYEYANEYYTNNISLSKGISIKYIVDGKSNKVHVYGHTYNGGLVLSEIPFSEIIGCEVFSDSKVVGGIKRAVVGGILAGDTGALIGTMTAQPHIMSYKIVIYRSNIQNPTMEIELIKEKTATKSKDYTSAVDFSQKVLASIKAIVHTCNK